MEVVLEFFFNVMILFFLIENFRIMLTKKSKLDEGSFKKNKMKMLPYGDNEFLLVIKTREGFAKVLLYYLTFSETWLLYSR
jgi:hypothetical protein